ncbi:hypothetical protein Hjap01_00290 [Haloarcula japonica]
MIAPTLVRSHADVPWRSRVWCVGVDWRGIERSIASGPLTEDRAFAIAVCCELNDTDRFEFLEIPVNLFIIAFDESSRLTNISGRSLAVTSKSCRFNRRISRSTSSSSSKLRINAGSCSSNSSPASARRSRSRTARWVFSRCPYVILSLFVVMDGPEFRSTIVHGSRLFQGIRFFRCHQARL